MKRLHHFSFAAIVSVSLTIGLSSCGSKDKKNDDNKIEMASRETTMTKEDEKNDFIEKRIKEMTTKLLRVNANEVNSNTRFADLGADDLDIVELIMEFEKEFNVKVADEEGDKIVTVGDAVTYFQAHVK